MQDRTSEYQALKIWLAGILPVERDILHVLIGLTLVLVAVILWRIFGGTKPFVWALTTACALAVGMEVLDMNDDIRTIGVWRWRASLMDFARTVSIPLLAFLIAFQLKRKAHLKSSAEAGSTKRR